MNSWPNVALGSVINLKRGFDLPSHQRAEGNVPIFSSSGISAYHNQIGAKGPGVITGRYGTIGLVFYSNEDYWPLNTTLFVENFKSNYPKFIYYALKNFDFEKFQDKSAVPGINRNDVHTELIPLPSLPEQKNIADVLSSLDDKIGLLHRQNATLEAIAETLFRQWFVEAIKIEGAKIGRIVDLVEFNPKRKLAKGTVAPYLEMAALSTATFHPDSWYDREFASGTKFMNGDTLLARITPCLENGKSAYITFLKDDEVAWGSTEYIVMRSKLGLHPFFTYALARNSDFREYAEGCLEGSSGRQRVDLEHLMNYEIAVPDQAIISKFNTAISPIVPKLHANFTQIRILEKLRDNLLPKLISGEVRVNY